MTREEDKLRRPRGRPRAEYPHSAVSAWLSAPVHDRLIQRAKHAEQSVSATIRQLIVQKLEQED